VEDSFSLAIEELARRYSIIRDELGLFNEELLQKPEIVVLNKLDVLTAEPELVERARVALTEQIAKIRKNNQKPVPGEPFFISAVSGSGLGELKTQIYSLVQQERAARSIRERGTANLETPVVLPDAETLRRDEK
jgi:GTPase involved in cell partitioning and DNA repair